MPESIQIAASKMCNFAQNRTQTSQPAPVLSCTNMWNLASYPREKCVLNARTQHFGAKDWKLQKRAGVALYIARLEIFAVDIITLT